MPAVTPTEPEELGGHIAALETELRDGSLLNAEQVRERLSIIDDMAVRVRGLPAGDLQAFTAKVDQLRRQYGDWLDSIDNNQSNPR